MHTPKQNFLYPITYLIILSILLAGCTPTTADRPGSISHFIETITPTSPQTPSITPTPLPTYTPTPEPLGLISNPIVMGFIQSNNDEVVGDSITALIDYLQTTTGFKVSVQYYPTYQAAEEALRNNHLHFVWLDPIEYILASGNRLVQSALVTNHLGVTSYGIRILSHIDSPYTSFFDGENNKSTTDLYTALNQFSGSRPCFVQEPSLTGYLIPKGIFLQASVPFSEPVINYSTSANLRAIYVKGICDFTSTYSSFGDPRTASDLQRELPDIMDKVQVIWQSDSMIPNLNLSYSLNLELSLQNKIIESLTKFVKTSDGQNVLSIVTDYGIEDLQPIDDSYYDYLRFLLNSQEIDLYFILLEK